MGKMWFLATLSGSSDAGSPAWGEIIGLPDAGGMYSAAILWRARGGHCTGKLHEPQRSQVIKWLPFYSHFYSQTINGQNVSRVVTA
jgi:hypothetical protein